MYYFKHAINGYAAHVIIREGEPPEEIKAKALLNFQCHQSMEEHLAGSADFGVIDAYLARSNSNPRILALSPSANDLPEGFHLVEPVQTVATYRDWSDFVSKTTK